MVKIRTDFVTNSSTTSFILITDEEFEKRAFFRLVGITERSPLKPIFDSLFDTLTERMVPLSDHYKQVHSEGDMERLVREDFSEEVSKRVIAAKKTGKKIYVGTLNSDEGEIESFFCCDSYELENESTYLNALGCAW